MAMTVVLTTEELQEIRDQALARAEEIEWRMRRELARLREVETAMLAILGDTQHALATAPALRPRLAVAAAQPREVRALALRAALLENRQPYARPRPRAAA